MAEEKKAKRGVRRVGSARAASSPEPEGPVMSGNTCGHGGCGHACRVRYVGQTSHLRDHHALHAARGVTHVWSAAIVTGLAVVLTGTIGYSVVQARDGAMPPANTRGRVVAATREDVMAVQARLDDMQRMLETLRYECRSQDGGSSDVMDTGDMPDGEVRPDAPRQDHASGTDDGAFRNTLPHAPTGNGR